jgi:hypothetical protein
MKRKVRIYKDPFGNGGYINKTAQWLRKAQDGAETGATPVTQGIMQQMQSGQPQQAMQQQPEQDPQEQILQTVVALAQQGYGQDEIKDYLLQNIYGFDKASQEYAQYEPQILEFVSAVFEKSAPEEEEQEVTNEPIADIVEDTSMQDTSEEDNNYDQMINDIIYDDEDQEARYGGVPNKRSYVNKLVRKLRKAAKGDQVEEANTANVRGTEDNPTGTTGNKTMFVAGVKGQAQDHFLKKQAEEMYNNQFAQGMPQPDMQQPQGDMDYAQRGGWRMRRANRKMFGSPNLPLGVTSSKYSFGPLGGVRSAEVQFNPLMMASMFPMMSFPGMGGGSSWGYNQPYRKTTKGRLVTEKIASTVNNKSTEDVAKATDSDAANKSAEPKTDTATPNADGTVTVDNGGGAGTTVTPNAEGNNTEGTQEGTSNTGPFEVNGAREAMELRNRKDKWGRPMSDKWYGFDPKTKKWTLGRTPDWYKEPTKKSRWSNVTMKKDSWGRNEDSKWYGYDPKKKKYTEGPNKGKTTTQVKNKLEDKLNKELIKTFGSKVKPYLEYDSFKKNATAKERILNYLGVYGPSDPSLHGGFTDDDVLSYFAPTGLKGAPEAISFALKSPNLLGQGAKGTLGAGQKLLNPGQKLLNPGQKLLNPGQGLLEAPAGTQFVLPFAAGGFVNNPMQDQFGNLQKFIYGDQVDDQMLENLFQPPINQSDLDYTDSEDPSDPYFKKHGGLHRFQGTGDSETNPTNTGKTYSQEELDKLLAEKQKTWETDYQKKYDQQMQGQQQMMQGYGGGYNPYDSYSAWGSRGNYGGFGPYASTGILGAAGNLIKGFGRGPSSFSPVGNPLQYAATASAITNAGMLPTGMRYSKEKSDGLLGKLGLKHDRVTTLSYATPEQIKSGATNTNLSTNPTTPGTTPNDKSRNTDQFGLNKKLNFPGENNRPRLADARINAADRRADRKENRMANRDLRTGDVLKFTGPDMSNMQDMEIPSNIDISKGQTDPRFGYAFGGYVPDYMAYGGDIPMADLGINFSSVSYGPNSITQPGGIGQGKTGPCTEEEVKDPNSPCYDPMYAGQGPRVANQGPQTAELKIKEEKGPIDYTKASRGVLDFGANLADDQNYATERRTKYIPGMTEFAMGEKQAAEERINKGEWNARTGKEGIQGFEGIIRKGGAIKSKKSNASGHKINMNDFQSLLKLAGLI